MDPILSGGRQKSEDFDPGSKLAPFTRKVLDVIQAIPSGRVLSYGRVASLAGNPQGARQVARLLHSMSQKYDLPWHRVVNASGKISLPEGRGYELQKALLESEGICFSRARRIDFLTYLWVPKTRLE
ncbi:MAG: MGMT family protein [Desulfobacter sp.]|nr:MGMT family protein [Desulfobacter sp.]WDP86494.1 MAG: MGMT family protein [Desulfobacter sp.]